MQQKARPRAFVLSMETLPLDSIRHFFAKPAPEDFRSLCAVLVAMAQAGREDALTLLLGLAHRNRNDVARMLLLVYTARGLHHPEVVALLASEFTRVPSQPSSRTYLTTILDSLEAAHTPESWHALLDLAHTPHVGPRYRQRIRQYLESVSPPEDPAESETPIRPGV